jgi:hypothetical protein
MCFAALVLCGCSKDTTDVEDDCKATAKTKIEPLFRIHFLLTNEGGGPYTGEADFVISKFYCNGTENGVFDDHIASVNAGYWKPITTQYILANTKDYVTYTLTTPAGETSDEYYYEYVRQHMVLDEMMQFVFEDTVHVVVPE